MAVEKKEIKKLVKDELKKQGVEATDAVVDQLSEVAGSDLAGVTGGMNVAGKVALTVGGAVAVAALGAGGMYLGEKAYNKHKGIYNVSKGQDITYRIPGTDEEKDDSGKVIREATKDIVGTAKFDGFPNPPATPAATESKK